MLREAGMDKYRLLTESSRSLRSLNASSVIDSYATTVSPVVFVCCDLSFLFSRVPFS